MTDRRGSEEMWLMFLLFCQVMVYNGVAAALYLTAFLANAASVNPFRLTYFYGHLAAAAVSNWHHLHSVKYKACMLKYARNTVRSPSDNVSTNTNSCERFGQESLPFICSFSHPNAPIRSLSAITVWLSVFLIACLPIRLWQAPTPATCKAEGRGFLEGSYGWEACHMTGRTQNIWWKRTFVPQLPLTPPLCCRCQVNV